MNALFWLIPLSIGCITVLQGTINRRMGAELGLGAVVFLNAVIVMALATALYGVVRHQPGRVPSLFEGEFRLERLRWWMVFPGIFGFCIIAGIPWAISKLGAAKVFVAIVVAQMIASLAWDTLVEGKPLTMLRVGGAAMAIAGVVVVSMDRS